VERWRGGEIVLYEERLPEEKRRRRKGF